MPKRLGLCGVLDVTGMKYLKKSTTLYVKFFGYYLIPILNRSH